MEATIEISSYPLSENYEARIIDFIERCKASGMEVRTNATSTHVQGNYDAVMNLLNQEIKTSFEAEGQNIFVVKILKGKLDLDFSM